MTIDHIGIAVKNIEEAVPFYENALGLEVTHQEEVSAQGVRVAFLQAGQSSIELLEPLGDEGAIAKFLKTRGPGLHHVAFLAENVSREMRRLKKEGLPPLEEAPQLGARGHKVCFLHPRLAAGVLVELVGR